MREVGDGGAMTRTMEYALGTAVNYGYGYDILWLDIRQRAGLLRHMISIIIRETQSISLV